MTTTAVRLKDDHITVLAKVLDTLSPAEAGAALRSDAELAMFIEARQKLSTAASDLAYATRSTRR
jgi:hypothetical protein